MDSNPTTRLDVEVIELEGVMKITCTKCNKILSQGKFVIKITTDSNEYLVGSKTNLKCCDEEVALFFLFTEKKDAEQTKEMVASRLDQDENTLAFNLFALTELPTRH